MTRFTNPHAGMLDPTTDWGALNAGLVKFFLSVEIEAKTSQIPGTVGKLKTKLSPRRGNDDGKRVTTTHVGLKYMVELKGLTCEMLNDFYVNAGMEDGSLKKPFGNPEDCTAYIFGVRDIVKESLKETGYRKQAISNFGACFNIVEVDGQYQVTAKKDATDADKSEIAETIQSLLNHAKAVVKDWKSDTAIVPPPEPSGPATNNDRDKLLYELAVKHPELTWGEIAKRVNEKFHGEQLDKISAPKAANRYAEKRDLPPVPKRKAGRKPGKNSD